MRNPRLLARSYFAAQALGGALWWVGVATVPLVGELTLGTLPHGMMAMLDLPLFVATSLLLACGVRAAGWALLPWTAAITTFMAAYTLITGQAVWGALIMMVALCGSITALSLQVWGALPTQLLFIGPFKFRESASAPTTRHLLRTGAQLLLFWGVFLGIIPLGIVWAEHRTGVHLALPTFVTWLGWVLLLLASGLGVASAVVMAVAGHGTPLPIDTASRLVVLGPYRFVRNPMAVAGIVQGVGVGLILGSWLTVLYALVGSLVWNWLIRPGEEADLEARFGDDFRHYQAQVPCWVPRLIQVR